MFPGLCVSLVSQRQTSVGGDDDDDDDDDGDDFGFWYDMMTTMMVIDVDNGDNDCDNKADDDVL